MCAVVVNNLWPLRRRQSDRPNELSKQVCPGVCVRGSFTLRPLFSASLSLSPITGSSSKEDEQKSCLQRPKLAIVVLHLLSSLAILLLSSIRACVRAVEGKVKASSSSFSFHRSLLFTARASSKNLSSRKTRRPKL